MNHLTFISCTRLQTIFSNSVHKFIKMLQDLPDDILLLIFGYLSTFEIFKNVALICKNCYRVSRDYSFIQDLQLLDLSRITANAERYFEFLEVLQYQSKNVAKLTFHGIASQAIIQNCLNIASNACSKLSYLDLIVLYFKVQML